MGAWTTRIMDDDGVRDIIDEYKILMGYGVQPEDAYKAIYEYFYKDYEGEDDEDTFWLAVALYQWKNGILREEVKEKALSCIDDDEYLERWKDSGEKVYQKRREVLAEFRDNLLHKVNEAPKKFPKCPKYLREKTCWKVGDLLVYQIIGEPLPISRKYNQDVITRMATEVIDKIILLRVVDIFKCSVTELMPELDYSSSAHVMLYDWMEDKLPDEKTISELKFRPVVADAIRGKYRLVSSVSLEWRNSKLEKEQNIIKRISTDSSFISNYPAMYKEHPSAPIQTAGSFNISLIETFSMDRTESTEWMYDD